ncbi:MAG: 16S rRNA (cytidine(1402)-2'-O)-methyltransferase [Candidatus Liptonbacteria bacterium]|nr:16S rRNA (cytidine(1402)-2'-O)-methyltransferase [Candidatus Liptonbacteria bacterium]
MLYLVSTPIGNLGDISERAIATLRSVDVVLVEKWTDSIKLLKHFGIRPKQLLTYDDRNAKRVLPRLLALLAKQDAALITSAGTPGVSDPGAELVRACHAQNMRVVPIPGPSAVTAAIAASGLGGSFTFLGFLPKKRKELERVLADAAAISRTLVVFESPHRIEKTLAILAETHPNMPMFLGKELTKLHEQCTLATPAELLEAARENPKSLWGEFTLVLQPGQEKSPA